MTTNPTIDSAGAVKAAYEYLMKASPAANKLSNFRLEEISVDENKDFLITLSYDVVGEFGFDKQREYKKFKVIKDGSVEWMKIFKS